MGERRTNKEDGNGEILSAEEQSVVAREIIKKYFHGETIFLGYDNGGSNMERRISNMATKLDIQEEKLVAFLKPVLMEIIEESFN